MITDKNKLMDYPSIESVLESLKKQIKSSENHGENADEASWQDEKGVLLSRIEAASIVSFCEKTITLINELEKKFLKC